MSPSDNNETEIPKQVLDEARAAGAAETLVEFARSFPEHRVSCELKKAATSDTSFIDSIQRLNLGRALWVGDLERIREYTSGDEQEELEEVLFPDNSPTRDFTKFAADSS